MTARRDPLTITQAVLDAQARVQDWPADLWLNVSLECPDDLDAPADAWVVTVETFRRPDESPYEAAKRLGLYLTLHRERYGQVPRLDAIQHTSAQRTIQERKNR